MSDASHALLPPSPSLRLERIYMLLAIALALMVTQTLEVSQPEMRHSPTTYRSDRTLIELQMCMTRYWAQAGTITPIPLTGGVTLDFYTKGIFGPGKARLSFVIEEHDQRRRLGVAYRHPLNAKSAARALTPAVQICSPESLAVEPPSVP